MKKKMIITIIATTIITPIILKPVFMRSANNGVEAVQESKLVDNIEQRNEFNEYRPKEK